MFVEGYFFNHYPPRKRHVSALFESMMFRFIKAKMPFQMFRSWNLRRPFSYCWFRNPANHFIYPNSGCEVAHLMSFHLSDDTFLAWDKTWGDIDIPDCDCLNPRGTFLLHCLGILWRKWLGNAVSSSHTHRCSWWLSWCSSVDWVRRISLFHGVS